MMLPGFFVLGLPGLSIQNRDSFPNIRGSYMIIILLEAKGLF